MTSTHPGRRILSAGLLSLSALILASCSGAEEAAVSPDSSNAASDNATAPAGPSTPDRPELTGVLPDVLPGEGDGSVDHGTNPLTEGERVQAQPDSVSFHVEPAEGLTVTSGMVTIHWAATADGVPVAAEDCSGMLSIVAPDGGTLTFEPGITGCAGSTGILLGEAAGAQPGDYVVSVMLDSVSGEQTISVAADA